jgi:hypothetical protein
MSHLLSRWQKLSKNLSENKLITLLMYQCFSVNSQELIIIWVFELNRLDDHLIKINGISLAS